MSLADPAWRKAVDADSLAFLRGDIALLVTNAKRLGVLEAREIRDEDEIAAVKADINTTTESIVARQSSTFRMLRGRARKMMWTKTGAGRYEASDGSGFEASVHDEETFFSVRIKDGDTVEVPGDSLDKLKVAVTEMSMRRAS